MRIFAPLGTPTILAFLSMATWTASASAAPKGAIDQARIEELTGAKGKLDGIHQNMTGEQPRVLFLHYWGIGKAAELAGAVTAALKETKHDGTP